MSPTTLTLVALGGALGSVARYLVATWVPAPFGTLVVNLLGSAVIAAALRVWPHPDVRTFVATGMLGGFTTYSAFNQETLVLLQTGAWGTAALYSFGTLVVCLLAGSAGFAAAGWLLR